MYNRALDVRLPEQFSIIGKLRAHYPVVTLCHVFGVHRSSYRYWKNRPEKPDGRRAVLRSQVLELHGISHGSAGARSIATMATRRGYQMGRWLAGRLMKELGLVSCQQPTHRYLQNAGLEVLEVTAPDRMERRKRGKSDTIDAECAAHAAFSGIRTVTPKTRNGMIESLRVLKTCRKTAISARRVALQIIHSNIISAPDELREQLRNMTRMQLIRTLGSWRPDASEYRNVTNVYRISLKSLARRYLELHDEIADLDVMIAAIVDELAPELIKRNAIGYESASQLLITAGDNPQRLRSESGFAALCGVSPVPVSSGKTNRYRLNRGGDRAANSALHIIAIGRLRTDDKTKEYVARRVAEGHTKMEAIRCLKRYISREVYTLLRNQNRQINSIPITA
ncbi:MULTISPECIES: transposase [Enterobacteriaceae]|uniref:transposase n=1 Tax=Enterobacteriaceae TaxID=543 RepID=UPI00201F5970|nr:MULTISPECIES: transposase [Enterobacteriaceae]MDC8870019.1 transposase [Escherichia coli]